MQAKTISSTVNNTRRSVIAMLIVSILSVAALTGERAYFDVQLSAAKQLREKAVLHNSEVLMADEILTTSAVLYATTGAPKWKERYEATVPKMDKALGDVLALATAQDAERFKAETSTANDALIAMEGQAFEKGAAQDFAGAKAILNSAAYASNKEILAKGSDNFVATLDGHLAAADKKVETQSLLVRTLSLLALLIIAGVWWRLNLNLTRFERNFKQSEEGYSTSELARMGAEAEAERARNLSNEQRNIRDAAVAQFQSNMSDTRDFVATHANNLQMTSMELLDIAKQTTGAMEATNQASENSHRHAIQIRSAAEELQASIANVANQIDSINAASKMTTDLARKSNAEIVTFAEAAKRVETIVDMIDAVAEKTNLLALNATIEAARAGDAGKGFAVVASEVKALANQTALATSDISEQIKGIREFSNAVVNSMDQVVSNADATLQSVMEISAVIGQQSATTDEVTRSANQGVAATDNLNELIREIHMSLSRASEAAMNISNVSEGLNESSSHLDSSILKFLKAMD